MKEQGYDLNVILKQDNSSTKLLLDNGRSSASKRTRHLNIRYYYLHDCIKRGDLTTEYCSTDEMTADYLNKPLQGKQFYKLRKKLMNIK